MAKFFLNFLTLSLPVSTEKSQMNGPIACMQNVRHAMPSGWPIIDFVFSEESSSSFLTF